MTTQEQMIKQHESDLRALLNAAIKSAAALHNWSQNYDWNGMDCELDERDLGEKLKQVYNAFATGNQSNRDHQDELFKN